MVYCEVSEVLLEAYQYLSSGSQLRTRTSLYYLGNKAPKTGVSPERALFLSRVISSGKQVPSPGVAVDIVIKRVIPDEIILITLVTLSCSSPNTLEELCSYSKYNTIVVTSVIRIISGL